MTFFQDKREKKKSRISITSISFIHYWLQMILNNSITSRFHFTQSNVSKMSNLQLGSSLSKVSTNMTMISELDVTLSALI